MLQTIHLHGAAKQRFGGPFRLAVNTPAEAVRALSCQHKGFEAFLRSADWRIIRGEKKVKNSIGLEELHLQFGAEEHFHMVPMAAGAANGKGIGKIVVGVAIAVAAVVLSIPSGGTSIVAGLGAEAAFGVSFGSIALAGASIALAGVSQLLAKKPTVNGYSNREAPDQRPSFLFNGPTNTVEQGATIPVIAGRKIRVGSVVISAGIFTERFKPT
jgi:predicted phage tail protein